MATRGRPRKPDAIKIAQGTYRADRQGDPADKMNPEGEPIKPDFADLPDAGLFWDEYVPQLIEMGVATRADSARLQVLCESWALLRKATKVLADDPLDKFARTAYAEFAKQFNATSSEFGLTPSARSKIVVAKPAAPAIQGRTR